MRLNLYSLMLISVLAIAMLSGPNRGWSQEAWQAQETGVKASLRGLCVVDSKTVWASGSEGTVVNTVDGGKHWTRHRVPGADTLDFRDIHAFDNNTAVILSAGQPARVYRTVNGGETWQQTFEHPHPKSFFDALSFWDNKHGLSMSDPVDGRVLLIETKNGGKDWQELPASRRPHVLPGEAGFAASGTNMRIQGERVLIALGGGKENQHTDLSRIVHSSDRCQSWSVAMVPLARNPSSGIFSMAFANEKIGVAVGGNYLKPEDAKNNAALSNDGGLTWRKPNGRRPRGYRSGVAFFRSQGKLMLIAVGPSGTDVSDDLGDNWSAASETGFHAVAFAEDGAGWASGSDGRIGKWIRIP